MRHHPGTIAKDLGGNPYFQAQKFQGQQQDFYCIDDLGTTRSSAHHFNQTSSISVLFLGEDTLYILYIFHILYTYRYHLATSIVLQGKCSTSKN